MTRSSRGQGGFCSSLFAVLLICFLPKAAASSADFYVAMGGSDANAGTANAPFRTLPRARDAVRKRLAAGPTKNLLVEIGGGRYEQEKPLLFGPEDSGSVEFSVTYAAAPDEEVVITGGRCITGWRKGSGDIWTAEVPGVREGNWNFRELFVNGRRAVRARTPNVSSPEPWCRMISSTARTDEEKEPVQVKLAGFAMPFRIVHYQNPGDIELVYICNNDMGRKRVAWVDERSQRITLATPNRWNAKAHGQDWYLSFLDTRWKECYLENALEMLDEPGEWYLDRTTGTLSYWPRPGEDITRATVAAPVARNTLLQVAGSMDRPVMNLHFDGLRCEHVEWDPPDYGYMGLFCCMLDFGPPDHLDTDFIPAAVEFANARMCSFSGGGVAHVGGMGICLRKGTADITIEGNEIADVAGGGIGASETRQPPIGQRPWDPPPRPGDYAGYRIANNHIHDCGTVYYGANGITLLISHNCTVVHNLIHDIAYSGFQWGGDTEGGPRGFTRNNLVAYNHIYRTTQVTVDGGGFYVTQTHSGDIIRCNLIHETLCNPFNRGASAAEPEDRPNPGLYLDGDMTGGRFEENLVYGNASGPLLFNAVKTKSEWRDNLFQQEGTPPNEYIEVVKALTGLEPAYQKRLLGIEPNPCLVSPPVESMPDGSFDVRQYYLPARERGVVRIMRERGESAVRIPLRMQGLTPGRRYGLKVYHGMLAPAAKDFYAEYTKVEKLWLPYANALGDLPILSDVGNIEPATIGLKTDSADHTVAAEQLAGGTEEIELPAGAQVVWIAYRAE